MMRALDCQGLGGGFGLGVVQAGFELVHKVEQDNAFGIAQMDDNRHLLGENWTSQAANADEWETFDEIDLVYGAPPCSGFSMMSVRAGSGLNRADRRGPGAAINSCMWDFADYVARNQPQIAIMESVQTAGKTTKTGGRELMRQLREYVNANGKANYSITHTFHNGASLGGSSIRARYFLVFHRIPFGFDANPLLYTGTKRVPHLADVMGDLPIDAQPHGETIPYPTGINEVSDWARPRRARALTGHFITRETPHQRRVFEVARELDWQAGEPVEAVLERYYAKHGEFPSEWGEKVRDTILHRPLRRAEDWHAVQAGDMTKDEYETKHNSPYGPNPPQPWQSGAYSTKRWYWDRAARVITGGGAVDNIHPIAPRTFTFREIARIMGFPDDWKVDTYWPNSHMVFGKAVIVECGRWIARTAADAINGVPGEYRGTEVGDGEFVVNFTNDHKAIYNERTGEHGDFRSKELIKEMESRV